MTSATSQPRRKPPPPHAISLLLSTEENECLFGALHPRCQSQATAVVEVYGTAPANHNIWNKLGIGIATFIKDNSRRSYFIQVYDSQICSQQTSSLQPLLIEQEIYREFSYHVSREFFHQFEGDERMIGLNFAVEEEARLFSTAVQSLLSGRQKKRDERKREAIHYQQKLLLMQQQEQAAHQERVIQIRRQQQHDVKEQHQSKSSKYKTIRGIKNLMDKYGNSYKEKPRKLEIGRPTDFKHISHAGLDSAFNVNPDIEELLNNIGLGSRDISEPKTQRYVMDFIENVGGMDEVRKMNRKLSTNRGLSPGPYSPHKASRQAHGFPEIEEERSPTSSFTTPPPESPAPTLPAEYLYYRPPIPPRDPSSGTYLGNAPVPPAPRNVTQQSGHGNGPSLYSTKVSSNEGNQRFPTTPSGRQLPVIQNTSSTGNPRPSMAPSKTGPLRTPQSPSSEAFTNNGVVPPSPPMPRSLQPPLTPTYNSSGPPLPPQRMTGSYGSLPGTKPPLLAAGHGLAPTPPYVPSGWKSAPTPPALSGGRGITPIPPMPCGGGSAPPPPPMPGSSGSAPPPPPMPRSSGSAPTPPSMPKHHGRAPLPPQMTPSTGLVPTPPPLPSSMGPVPPPPPMPTGKGLAPQPPPMPRNNQSAPDNQHSVLLEQIRGTHTLKSVSAQAPKKKAPTNARMELLERIRTGVTLTHVETSESKGEDSDAPAKLEGWALDLHNALVKREQFIQSSDDSEDDDVDDDDEWDESD